MSSATPPTTRRSAKASPTKSEATPPKGKVIRAGIKKESFKWNTPADEFADDVASDAEEEEGEFLGNEPQGSPIAAEIDGEQYEAHRTADGGIVIHLGVEEADKLMKKDNAESAEDIQRFLDSYSSKAEKSAEKKKKVKQKFQCPKCPKVWNWPWELRRHVITHYKEKERQATSTYKCDDCGKGFQWKRDLAQHQRLHTGEKLLVCSVCEKKFTTRQALLHHVVVHTGEKPFQCALCGNRFTQPANLRTHMKKKHGESGIEGNKCPHCQEPFPSIIAVHQHILEDHQNIVAEEREAQTMDKMKREQEKAERELIKAENRKKRMEKRKDKMDYNDFRSKGMQEWEINYEFHIGEGLVRGVDWDRTPSNGELNCEICDRKFGWRYEVMFHNLCHKTDEHGNTKNRVCPECDTAFKVPIGLKHHLLLHTGELPFLCLHCWRSFSSHIDLKLHIRKDHLGHFDTPAENQQEATTPKQTPTSSGAPKAKRVKKVKVEKAKADAQMGQNHYTVVTQDGVQQHITTEMMMSNQGGHGQTILLAEDGTVVQTGEQDMIVVIQSEDFDQTQNLIMVDPSQLQHIIGSDGQPVTVMQGEQGQETMIVTSTGQESKVIVSQAPVSSVPSTMGQIVTTMASAGTNAENGETMTLIVSDQAEDQTDGNIASDQAEDQAETQTDKGNIAAEGETKADIVAQAMESITVEKK